MSSTQDSDSASRAPIPAEPYLFRVFDAGRPGAPTARHSLADLDSVTIGRGELDVKRTDSAGKQTLVLTVPDPKVSSTHAHLRKVLGRWMIEDAGSRNGIVRNGTRETRLVLGDGDLLELGGTFFIFRAALAAMPGPRDVTSTSLGGPTGLTSLLPALAVDFGRLQDIARSTVSVVIHGETGTGKELVARAVHTLSQRPGQFVAVNCGALPETLIETELFGHRKGAFSGAHEDRPGLIRSADRGTLLLDEIGDLPLASQAAFLRALQERQVVPVGGTKPIAVDIRLCAATHHSLEDLVADDDFRADLFARISGYTIRLPPLRQRREDLGLVIATLLQRAPGVTLTKEAGRALFRHDWPLNIRELEKCLEAAIVVAGTNPIAPAHLPAPVVAQPAQRGAEATRPPPQLSPADQQKRDELLALLSEHHGNISAVARAMGKERLQIRRWLQRFQIDLERFKA